MGRDFLLTPFFMPEFARQYFLDSEKCSEEEAARLVEEFRTEYEAYLDRLAEINVQREMDEIPESQREESGRDR